MRDWQRWHDDYADPNTELSQRLAVVQQLMRDWLDAQPARPRRLISMCAGQGHDVAGALRGHPRAHGVEGSRGALTGQRSAGTSGARSPRFRRCAPPTRP